MLAPVPASMLPPSPRAWLLISKWTVTVVGEKSQREPRLTRRTTGLCSFWLSVTMR